MKKIQKVVDLDESYNLPSQSSMRDSFHSTSEESDDDTLKSSTSDDESDSEMGVMNTSDFGWSCSYDKTLYSTGLAVQKLPNSAITVLQWLAMNLSLFTSHPSTSKSAFSDNLKVQSILHPPTVDCSYDLPITYKEARSMIEPYVVKKKNL